MFRIGSFIGILEARVGPVGRFEELQIKKCRKIQISEDARWCRYEPTRGNHSLHHHDRRASFYEHPPDYKRVRRSEAKQSWLTYPAVCILMRFEESRPSGRRSRTTEKALDYGHYSIMMSLRACCAFQNVIGRSRCSFSFLETGEWVPRRWEDTFCRND